MLQPGVESGWGKGSEWTAMPEESDLSVAGSFKTTWNPIGARRRVMFEEIRFKRYLPRLRG